jgi:hypothetical protein
MKYLKKTLLRLIQKIYRFVAPPNLLAFELSDTVDPLFGAMSGTPVDRELIAQAIKENIPLPFFALETGEALEIGGTEYLDRFFPSLTSFQLDFDEAKSLYLSSNRIIGDLRLEQNTVINKFDLILSTQVLSFIDEYQPALVNFLKMLKPGGILVGTEPHISPISVFDESRWGEWNRFTKRGLRKILESLSDEYTIVGLGNAYTSAALSLGVPAEELDRKRFAEVRDSHATILCYTLKKISKR